MGVVSVASGCMFVEESTSPRVPSRKAFIKAITAHWPNASLRDSEKPDEGEVNIRIEHPESLFQIDYMDPIIGCDGTESQCSELATILQPLYPKDATVWILNKDASRGAILRSGMSAEEAMSKNWITYEGP